MSVAPRWRGQVLYLIGRRARSTALLQLSLCAVTWLWARILLTSEAYGADALLIVVVTAPLLSAFLIAQTLYVSGEELESTSPRRWWLWRALHLTGATGLAAVTMSLAIHYNVGPFGAAELVRNTLGFAGMIALSGVIVGAQLAWLPVLSYAVVCLALGRHLEAVPVWFWPVASRGSEGATTFIAIQYAGAVLLYSVQGAKARVVRDLH